MGYVGSLTPVSNDRPRFVYGMYSGYMVNEVHLFGTWDHSL